ncbi:MAG: hypothetical protein ILO34_08420 [Kiritimatiellae bacterium]|nr:hypothetical protein [Kiritimatiellia bacterium]
MPRLLRQEHRRNRRREDMGGGVSGAVGDVFPKMEKARGVKIFAGRT